MGELDGGLCPRLRQLSKFFDYYFDGLCIHRVPLLPRLGSVHTCVLTGPYGSGKSSPQDDCRDGVNMLGRFASSCPLCQFCNVVCWGTLRPRHFTSLGVGEKAKATTARLLESAVPEVTMDTLSDGHWFWKEEFTSLVERTTALPKAFSGLSDNAISKW